MGRATPVHDLLFVFYGKTWDANIGKACRPVEHSWLWYSCFWMFWRFPKHMDLEPLWVGSFVLQPLVPHLPGEGL